MSEPQDLVTHSLNISVEATVNSSSALLSQAGRYVIGEEIARGGMGEVYRATDTVLNREVAVKVLHAKYRPDSPATRRFADEARITGQLQHPAIPPVHDLGTLPDGRPFLAMKLIKGNTLDDLLKTRPDPASDRGRYVGVFEAICQAIAYAHAHDVIHRDLKPANIMVGSFGEVQVMDWGLAKVMATAASGGRESDPETTAAETEIKSLRDSDGSFTQAGSILGTPAFMPPEQAVGAVSSIDTRSDVFGLGAILAVILTGSPPFVASSAETTRVKAAQGDVAECFAKLDWCGAEPELIALCKHCLSPKQDDRPKNAEAVANAVAEHRAAAAERVRQAELESVKSAEKRKRRRTQVVLWTVVGVMFAAIGVGYAMASLWRNAEQAKSKAVAAQEETEAARERLARVEYGRTIQVAYQEFRDNSVGAARKLLESTRADLRGWEYNYVHRLCHEELFSIRPAKSEANQFSSGISPDRSRAVVRGPDNTIGIWDLNTGVRVNELRGHTDKIDALEFSRDGSLLLSDSSDQTTRVWDIRTGTLMQTLQVRHSPLRYSHFSPDGSRILTVDADRVASLWDSMTGAKQLTLKDHTDEVLRPIFNHDGTRILGGAPGKIVKVWDAKTGAELFTLKDLPVSDSDLGDADTSGNLEAFFSPDGSSIAVCGWFKELVKLWDARTGAERFTKSGRYVYLDDRVISLFSPDGMRFLTQNTDGSVSVWDAVTGKEIFPVKGHSDSINFAGFHDQGKILMTLSFDGNAKVWDAKTGAELRNLRGHTAGVTIARFNRDFSRIITGSMDGNVKVWDAKTGAELRTLVGHSDQVYDIGFSADESKIVTASSDGVVNVWDTKAESTEILFPPRSNVSLFTPDWSQYLALPTGQPPTLRDARTGAVVRTFVGHTDEVWSAKLNSDASRLVSFGLDKTLLLWDTKLGAELRRMACDTKLGSNCEISPDGSRIAYGEGKIVRVWNGDSGVEIFALRHPDVTYWFTFNKDATHIATACNDGVVRIWDTSTGAELQALKGHGSGVTALSFSKDGTRLLAAGGDAVLRLWDSRTGEQLMTFLGHGQYVGSVGWSPDETRIVSTSQDGTIKLWDAKSGIEVLSLRSEGGFAWNASFSPDGKRILCIKNKKAVILDSRPFHETRSQKK